MKIGLTGTISCGKTTLVKELAKLPEFSEYYISTERSKYLRDLGIPLNTDSTLEGQIVFLAERSSELLKPKLITDRTVLDVMAFTKCSKSMGHYAKESYLNLASKLLEKYDYIFYVSPEGVDIEDNSVRETNAEYRDLIDFTIKNMLMQYSYHMKNVYVISGSTENRIKTIMEVVKF